MEDDVGGTGLDELLRDDRQRRKRRKTYREFQKPETIREERIRKKRAKLNKSTTQRDHLDALVNTVKPCSQYDAHSSVSVMSASYCECTLVHDARASVYRASLTLK
jgi:hypothetical protein